MRVCESGRITRDSVIAENHTFLFWTGSFGV